MKNTAIFISRMQAYEASLAMCFFTELYHQPNIWNCRYFKFLTDAKWHKTCELHNA